VTKKFDIHNTTPGEALAILLGVLFALLMIFAFQGWVVMLVMGALHAEVSASIPAISYWASLLVVFALGLVGSFFRSSK
jgi:hypothetical protein